MFRKLWIRGSGDNIGALLKGRRGGSGARASFGGSGVLCLTRSLEAEAYILTKEEGEARPFSRTIDPQFYLGRRM